MSSRGYLNQCTDLEKLDEICNREPISAYIGFDCTASSLHVGSLLQIMVLKLMQNLSPRYLGFQVSGFRSLFKT